jgi:hypothetical protein
VKIFLILLAFAIVGGGLIRALVTGRIGEGNWTLFDRRDDAVMFWIVWLFVAAIFGWFIYAYV